MRTAQKSETALNRQHKSRDCSSVGYWSIIVFSDWNTVSTVGVCVFLRLSVCIYVCAPLTTCMAELLGGCGSMSNWQGVCPKLLIWDSTAWEKKDRKKKKNIKLRDISLFISLWILITVTQMCVNVKNFILHVKPDDPLSYPILSYHIIFLTTSLPDKCYTSLTILCLNKKKIKAWTQKPVQRQGKKPLVFKHTRKHSHM